MSRKKALSELTVAELDIRLAIRFRMCAFECDLGDLMEEMMNASMEVDALAVLNALKECLDGVREDITAGYGTGAMKH